MKSGEYQQVINKKMILNVSIFSNIYMTLLKCFRIFLEADSIGSMIEHYDHKFRINTNFDTFVMMIYYFQSTVD